MSSESRVCRFDTQDGISLHCLHWPSKIETDKQEPAPLVLLHGGGANAHWWDHLGPSLSSRRSVYALDFRGHGDSDYPPEHFVGAFNTDLESMLTWLGRKDVILVGHSLGAAVALDHASRFALTRAIALIDLARGGTPSGGRRARLALSLRRTYRSREEAVERFRFLPEASHPDEAIRERIATHSVKTEPDGRFGYKFDPRWFSLPSRPRPDVRAVRCPAMLVRGGESTLLSADSARKFVSSLSHATLVEIPSAGHHVLIDQPARLLVALENFLSDVDASALGAD